MIRFVAIVLAAALIVPAVAAAQAVQRPAPPVPLSVRTARTLAMAAAIDDYAVYTGRKHAVSGTCTKPVKQVLTCTVMASIGPLRDALVERDVLTLREGVVDHAVTTVFVTDTHTPRRCPSAISKTNCVRSKTRALYAWNGAAGKFIRSTPVGA